SCCSCHSRSGLLPPGLNRPSIRLSSSAGELHVRDDRAAAEVQQRLEAVAADLARAEAVLAGHGGQLTELWALRQEADRLRAHAVSIRYRAGRDVNAPVTYYNGPGSGPGRRITPARAAGSTVLALAIVAAAIVGYRWYGDRTAAQNVAAQRQGEKAVDAQTAPFQVVVEGPDQHRGVVWALALDQELTKAQENALAPFTSKDLAAVQSYLAELHPRLLPWDDVPGVDVDTKDPGLKALLKRETGGEGMVGGDTYRLHFTTDRSSSVTIENIGVSDVSCKPSTAISSVEAPPAGEAPVPGVFLSLADPPGTPAVEVDDHGQAISANYFAHHKVDLGRFTTPGDIELQVGGVQGQLCSWRFQVDYLTADGERLSEKVDNHGRPFTVESLPRQLKQLVKYDLGGATDPAHWADCAVEPTRC
ncbi:hypothetical protein, partial [Kitasatospora sp. NPDC050463]|uniref:hypothetical protein n=1 Tax=Kitasatospora sp. NPDC050463 TaxID=3155786 RepID=UPI00340C641F